MTVFLWERPQNLLNNLYFPGSRLCRSAHIGGEESPDNTEHQALEIGGRGNPAERATENNRPSG